MSPEQLLDLVGDLGGTFYEGPAESMAREGGDEALRSYGRMARDRGLGLVLDGHRIQDEATLREDLRQAELLGARRLRLTLSSILCADRRSIGGYQGWQRHLRKVAGILRAVSQEAEDRGVAIGLENHQDATSEDLLWLCQEADSSHVGVTLDTGNPLAVGEDPVAFCRRVLPHLVHVHCKDYLIFDAPEGFRLVRCAFGDGAIDFASLIELSRQRPDVTLSLEQAANNNRYIRILADDYWAGLGDRKISEVLPVLRLWQERKRDGDYRTPWEKSEFDRQADYEREQLERSVKNARTLWLSLAESKAGELSG